jgi:hypothetical protein
MMHETIFMCVTGISIYELLYIYSQFTSTRPPPRSSGASHPSSTLPLRLLAHFSSLFHHSPHPAEIEVPYTRGLAVRFILSNLHSICHDAIQRNLKAERKSKEKAPVVKNTMTINVIPPSQPPNNDEQQSDGAAQGQQTSSQPQILVSTTKMPSPPAPDIVIKRAGVLDSLSALPLLYPC